MRKSIKVRERKLGREHAYGLAWKEERLAEIDPRLSERDRLSLGQRGLQHWDRYFGWRGEQRLRKHHDDGSWRHGLDSQ